MEIDGTFNARIKKADIVVGGVTNGQVVRVTAEVTISAAEAEAKFGEAFRHVGFACMRNQVVPFDDGDETITQFGYQAKKPPLWLGTSVHHLDLWGAKDKGQPVIKKITAGNNVESVCVTLQFDIDGCDDEKRIGALGAKVGHIAKIKIKPEKKAAFPQRAPQVRRKKAATPALQAVPG